MCPVCRRRQATMTVQLREGNLSKAMVCDRCYLRFWQWCRVKEKANA